MLKLQARISNVFTSQRCLSARFSTCFPFGGFKSLPPSVNRLFKGIPFPHDDKIQEHIQEPLLLGRRTKGNLAWYFHFISGIIQDSFQYHSFDIQGAGFFPNAGRLY